MPWRWEVSGLVRSETKSEPTGKMAAKAVWSKAARNYFGAAQCTPATAWTSQESLNLLVATIYYNLPQLRRLRHRSGLRRDDIVLLRFFGGLRERILKRDRFVCRACGATSPLVVHHRARRNEAKVLVTLRAGCHIRLHHFVRLRKLAFRDVAKIMAANCIKGIRCSSSCLLKNSTKRDTSAALQPERLSPRKAIW
jgi:hypothetical protein